MPALAQSHEEELPRPDQTWPLSLLPDLRELSFQNTLVQSLGDFIGTPVLIYEVFLDRHDDAARDVDIDTTIANTKSTIAMFRRFQERNRKTRVTVLGLLDSVLVGAGNGEEIGRLIFEDLPFAIFDRQGPGGLIGASPIADTRAGCILIDSMGCLAGGWSNLGRHSQEIARLCTPVFAAPIRSWPREASALADLVRERRYDRAWRAVQGRGGEVKVLVKRELRALFDAQIDYCKRLFASGDYLEANERLDLMGREWKKSLRRELAAARDELSIASKEANSLLNSQRAFARLSSDCYAYMKNRRIRDFGPFAQKNIKKLHKLTADLETTHLAVYARRLLRQFEKALNH